jgi:hypothetical protein
VFVVSSNLMGMNAGRQVRPGVQGTTTPIHMLCGYSSSCSVVAVATLVWVRTMRIFRISPKEALLMILTYWFCSCLRCNRRLNSNHLHCPDLSRFHITCG